MRTTTLIDIMADVAHVLSDPDTQRKARRMSSDRVLTIAEERIAAAQLGPSGERRGEIVNVIAWAILALHAHDSEEIKAGT